jgi:hypothetical protein
VVVGGLYLHASSVSHRARSHASGARMRYGLARWHVD